MNTDSHPKCSSWSNNNKAHAQVLPFPSLLPPTMSHRDLVAMDIGGIGYHGHQIDGVRILQAANDLLLFQRHEEVLHVCKLGLDRSQDIVFRNVREDEENRNTRQDESQGRASGSPSPSRQMNNVTREYRESMCIIAMQAYAELDRWDQVQPFLLSSYGEISRIPPRIVLMCILLFSKVRNFAAAESFSTEWLRAQNGWSMNQYCAVLEIYVRRVYISCGRWQEAREYIEANNVLSPERKMRYLKYLAELQRQRGDTEARDECKTKSGSILLNLIHKLRSFFSAQATSSKGSRLHRMQNLAIISVFLYLLLFRSNTSTPTGASHATVVWSGIIGLWRSLFAPFHVMSQET